MTLVAVVWSKSRFTAKSSKYVSVPRPSGWSTSSHVLSVIKYVSIMPSTRPSSYRFLPSPHVDWSLNKSGANREFTRKNTLPTDSFDGHQVYTYIPASQT